MRRISTEKLEPGMIVGRPVFSDEGRILLNSGVELKQSFIYRLLELGIPSIYIQDEYGEFHVPELISEATRNHAIQTLRRSVNQIQLGQHLNVDCIEEVVGKIIDEVLTNDDVLVGLADIRSFDNYTYAHCVNVALLSLVCGISLKLSQEDLRHLTLGAILHDLGKVRIPEQILNKPGRLSKEEFKLVSKHPIFGYELVRKHEKIPRRSANVVYQHHERYNGAGYPQGLAGEEIDYFARIAAIADVYDAITADRVYQQGITPFAAIRVLKSLGSFHFDLEILEHFVKNIALYPVGSTVTLSDQRTGVVIDVNKRYSERPTVRVIFDSEGKKLKEPEDVDLMEAKDLVIVETCGSY